MSFQFHSIVSHGSSHYYEESKLPHLWTVSENGELNSSWMLWNVWRRNYTSICLFLGCLFQNPLSILAVSCSYTHYNGLGGQGFLLLLRGSVNIDISLIFISCAVELMLKNFLASTRNGSLKALLVLLYQRVF